MTKRRRTLIPALLRAATITTPYAIYCQTCGAKYGETSNPPFPDAPPAICSLCKRAMREGRAA